MQKLINNEKLFGDVLLKPNSGQPLYAHKGNADVVVHCMVWSLTILIAVLAARSPVLSEKIKEADKSSNGTVPVLDFSQYNPKQLYSILIYIYTYRLMSSNLDSEELHKFVKLYKIKEPAPLRTPPPIILAADMGELLSWKTATDKSNEGDVPLIVKNSSPYAGLWADIKFMVQGREIAAHKAILCANSEYFRYAATILLKVIKAM